MFVSTCVAHVCIYILWVMCAGIILSHDYFQMWSILVCLVAIFVVCGEVRELSVLVCILI